MYVYVDMSSKTVSLSEEAYNRLKIWKINDNESFSEEVLRLLPKHRDVGEILRKAKHHLSEEEAEKMKKDIE